MKTAFFCVDALVSNAEGDALVAGSTCIPVAPTVTRLLEIAKETRATLLGTTCMGGGKRGPSSLQPPNGAWLAWETAQTEWQGWLEGVVSMIILERRRIGDRDADMNQRSFDVFAHHPQAAAVVQAVGAQRWIVFGASLEYCTRATVLGLLKHQVSVEVVTDACVGSPAGNEKSRQAAWEALVSAGAKTTTTEEVLATLHLERVTHD